MQTIIVTGCAGFIGYTLSLRLLENSNNIVGIDNFYNNYSVKTKKNNIFNLGKFPNFNFYETNILDFNNLKNIFLKHSPQKVVHLAGLTGVRASLDLPKLYQSINVEGTKNLYLISSEYGINQFIFSSSSSVYGSTTINTAVAENFQLSPQSPYAKTKADAEICIKKIYSNYKIPSVIVRLFSVYGPHGRPDMAPYLFTDAAFKNKIMPIYGKGDTLRDYTYVDDVVEAIIKITTKKFHFEVFNIGSSNPIQLNRLIHTIEIETDRKIQQKKLALNSSEAFMTFANITKARTKLHWKPKTDFYQGMKKFINWYKNTQLNKNEYD